MKFIGKKIVDFVVFLKKITGMHTFQLEYIFVLLILILTMVISHQGWIEFIGVLAVFFSFAHAKVASRLAEREELRNKNKDAENMYPLPYYYKVVRWFYLKEICWLLYFVYLGAWSALVGVIIFLMYEPWRRLWRTYNSLEEKLQRENKSNEHTL